MKYTLTMPLAASSSIIIWSHFYHCVLKRYVRCLTESWIIWSRHYHCVRKNYVRCLTESSPPIISGIILYAYVKEHNFCGSDLELMMTRTRSLLSDISASLEPSLDRSLSQISSSSKTISTSLSRIALAISQKQLFKKVNVHCTALAHSIGLPCSIQWMVILLSNLWKKLTKIYFWLTSPTLIITSQRHRVHCNASEEEAGSSANGTCYDRRPYKKLLFLSFIKLLCGFCL